ncbi:hypothetical protein [Streptomyces sp. NPDC056512]|uniref:hypothetical protein n=1 Tax=Streptomyces sp. NPDC056512 TaxID=3345846 RepID=UPI0036B7AF4A
MSTSTAAFVGLAEMGPEEATRVTNWTEFQRVYGSFMPGGFLAHSVCQYFNNGGRQCYVVRVTAEEAHAASVTLRNRAQDPELGVIFSAMSDGEWGNGLVLQIEDGTTDPGNTFKVSVRRQADPAVVPADFNSTPPSETFDNLSIDPESAGFVTAVLKAQSNLIRATVLPENRVVQQGSLRGGEAPEESLATPCTFQIDLDGDGFQDVTLPAGDGSLSTADAAAAIEQAVGDLTAHKESNAAAFAGFTCQLEADDDGTRLVLRSGTKSAASSVRVQSTALDNAADKLKLSPAAGGRPEDGLALRRPMLADVVQVGDAVVGGPVAAVVKGDGTQRRGTRQSQPAGSGRHPPLPAGGRRRLRGAHRQLESGMAVRAGPPDGDHAAD